jgi:pimeloyl-ACP methyl ester carboxylesterase
MAVASITGVEMSAVVRVLSLFATFVLSLGCPAAGAVAPQSRAPLSPGSHDAVVNGVRLHYEVAGSGPLLVVQAPGWGVGSSYLQKGLSVLQASFTVITYDPRNSGKSDRVRDPASLNDMQMVEDLEGLRQAWDVGNFALLGHSNGGAIALAYAESYPGRVTKLVLAGTEGPDLLAGSDHGAQDRRRARDPRFADAYRHVNDATESDDAFLQNLKRTLPLYLSDPTQSLADVAATLPDSVTVSSTAVYKMHPGKPRLPPMDATDRIHVPVLLVVGEDDWPCTPAPSRRIHAHIKDSVLHVYPHAGHFTWMERPDLFFPDVTTFLRHAS